MVIVRALWGSWTGFEKEIPNKPLFSEYNEVVFVWGIQNKEYLDTLGYNTILVSKDDSIYGDAIFQHKLDALKLAYEKFNEVLFLDWDVNPLKQIDNKFIKNLSSPSMPLYSYPKGYHEWMNTDSILIEQIKQYSWHWNNMYVLPNASFIYFKDFDLGDHLKRITEKYRLRVLIEEFAFKVFCNCDLNEYITKYNSKFLYGRPDSQLFNINQEYVNTSKQINDYVDSITPIESYFIHE